MDTDHREGWKFKWDTMFLFLHLTSVISLVLLDSLLNNLTEGNLNIHSLTVSIRYHKPRNSDVNHNGHTDRNLIKYDL